MCDYLQEPDVSQSLRSLPVQKYQQCTGLASYGWCPCRTMRLNLSSPRLAVLNVLTLLLTCLLLAYNQQLCQPAIAKSAGDVVNSHSGCSDCREENFFIQRSQTKWPSTSQEFSRYIDIYIYNYIYIYISQDFCNNTITDHHVSSTLFYSGSRSLLSAFTELRCSWPTSAGITLRFTRYQSDHCFTNTGDDSWQHCFTIEGSRRRLSEGCQRSSTEQRSQCYRDFQQHSGHLRF